MCLRTGNFPWPKGTGHAENPVWCGTEFRIGAETCRVLVFDVNESHWSPELTALHEEEAGANHPIDRASRQAAVRSLQRFVRKAAPVVMDVGSSSGYVLEAMREALPDALLIASDYILPPLLKLGETMPDIPILQFDLRRCPLPDNSVDAITALNVLEHIDQDREALAQIHRVLRPGGMAHIEVPAGPALFDIYDEHLMHHRRYRLPELMAMAKEIGFEILQATHLGFFAFPAFWFAKKRNRRLLSLPIAEKRRLVAAQIRGSQQSKLLSLSFFLERFLGQAISWPWGVRAIVVVRKRLSSETAP
jgi:SAM-dependent methyltransferase